MEGSFREISPTAGSWMEVGMGGGRQEMEGWESMKMSSLVLAPP